MAEMQDLDVQEVGELEVVEEQIQQADVAPEATQEPELPEKYKGKSAADIAKMHQEAEKLLARQGAEVGEVRKLADELLKSQLQRKPEPEKPKEVDFFENPQEAIRQAVENNPKVLAAEQYAKQVQMEQAAQKIATKHPDFREVVRESEFEDWIKSSKIRQHLFLQAEAYDADAADELLSTYKALRTVKQKQVTEVDTKVRDQSLKAASVETSGSGESTRKIYRRADLIRLKLRDSAKFDAMQDEIDAAYREGRVK